MNMHVGIFCGTSLLRKFYAQIRFVTALIYSLYHLAEMECYTCASKQVD